MAAAGAARWQCPRRPARAPAWSPVLRVPRREGAGQAGGGASRLGAGNQTINGTQLRGSKSGAAPGANRAAGGRGGDRAGAGSHGGGVQWGGERTCLCAQGARGPGRSCGSPGGGCESVPGLGCVNPAPDANDEIKMSSKLNAGSIRRLGAYNGKWD